MVRSIGRRVDLIMYDLHIFLEETNKISLWQDFSTAIPVLIWLHSKLKVIVQVNVPVWRVWHCKASGPQFICLFPLSWHLFQSFVLKSLRTVCCCRSLVMVVISCNFLLADTGLHIMADKFKYSFNQCIQSFGFCFQSFTGHHCNFQTAVTSLSFLPNTPDFLRWVLSLLARPALIGVLSVRSLCSWSHLTKVYLALLLRLLGNKLFKMWHYKTWKKSRKMLNPLRSHCLYSILR